MFGEVFSFKYRVWVDSFGELGFLIWSLVFNLVFGLFRFLERRRVGLGVVKLEFGLRREMFEVGFFIVSLEFRGK